MSFEVIGVTTATSILLLDLQSGEELKINAGPRIEVPKLFVPGSGGICEPFALDARDAVRRAFLGRPVEAEQLPNGPFCVVTRNDGETIPLCLLKRGLAHLHASMLKSNSRKDSNLVAAQTEAQRQRLGIWSTEHRGAEAQCVPAFPLLRDELQREMLALELQRRWIRVSVEHIGTTAVTSSPAGGGNIGSKLSWLFDAVIVSSSQEIRFQIAGILCPLSQPVAKQGKMHLMRRMMHRVVDVKIVGYDRASCVFCVAFRDERVERLVAAGLAHVDRRLLHLTRSPQGLLVASAVALKEKKGIFAAATGGCENEEQASGRGAASAAAASSKPAAAVSPDVELALSLSSHDFVAKVVDVLSESSLVVEFLRFYALHNVQSEMLEAMQQQQHRQQQEESSAAAAEDGNEKSAAAATGTHKLILDTIMVTTRSVAGSDLTSSSSSFQFSSSNDSSGGAPWSLMTQQQLNEYVEQNMMAEKLMRQKIVVNIAFIHDDVSGGSQLKLLRKEDGAQQQQQHHQHHHHISLTTSTAALNTRQFLRHTLIGQAVLVRPFVEAAASSNDCTMTTTLVADVLLRQQAQNSPSNPKRELSAAREQQQQQQQEQREKEGSVEPSVERKDSPEQQHKEAAPEAAAGREEQKKIDDNNGNAADMTSNCSAEPTQMETSTITERILAAHAAPCRELLPVHVPHSIAVPPPEPLCRMLESSLEENKRPDSFFAPTVKITRCFAGKLLSESLVKERILLSRPLSGVRALVEEISIVGGGGGGQQQQPPQSQKRNSIFTMQLLFVDLGLLVPARLAFADASGKAASTVASLLADRLRFNTFLCDVVSASDDAIDVLVLNPAFSSAVSSSAAATAGGGSSSLALDNFPTFNHGLLAVGVTPLRKDSPLEAPCAPSIADALLTAKINAAASKSCSPKKKLADAQQQQELFASNAFPSVVTGVTDDGRILLQNPVQTNRVHEAMRSVGSMPLYRWEDLQQGQLVLALALESASDSAVHLPAQRAVVETLLFSEEQSGTAEAAAAAAATSGTGDAAATQQNHSGDKKAHRSRGRGGRNRSKKSSAAVVTSSSAEETAFPVAAVLNPSSPSAVNQRKSQNQRRVCGCVLTLIDVVGQPRVPFDSLEDIRTLPDLRDAQLASEIDSSEIPNINTILGEPPLFTTAFLAFFLPESWAAAPSAVAMLRLLLLDDAQWANVIPLYDYHPEDRPHEATMCVLIHPMSNVGEEAGICDAKEAMKIQHALWHEGTAALDLKFIASHSAPWTL